MKLKKKERYKRVDLLLEAGKLKINLELNSTYNEEELEKYSKKLNNAIIKESVDNLKRLNSDAAFVYGLYTRRR